MLPRVPQSQPSRSRLARTISWKRRTSAASLRRREALLDLGQEVEIAEIAVAEAVVLPRAALQGAADGLIDLLAVGLALISVAGVGKCLEAADPHAGSAVAPGHGDGALGRRLLAGGAVEQAFEVRPEMLPLAREAREAGVEEAPVSGGGAEPGERQRDPGHTVGDPGQRLLRRQAGAPAEARSPRLGEAEKPLAMPDRDLQDARRAGGSVEGEQAQDGAGRAADQVEVLVAGQERGEALRHPLRGVEDFAVPPEMAEMGEGPDDPSPPLEGADRGALARGAVRPDLRLEAEGGDGGPRELRGGRVPRDPAQEAEEQGDAGEAGVEVFRRGLQRPGLVAVFEADPGGVVPFPHGHLGEPGAHGAGVPQEALPRRLGREPRRAGIGRVARPLDVVAIEELGAEREAEEPELAPQVFFSQQTDAAADELEGGLLQEVRQPFAAARPHVVRGGEGGEEGDVPFREVAVLGGDHPGEDRLEVGLQPEAVEQAVAVERVAQVVGVQALDEQHAVDPRRTEHHAHGIVREAGELAVELVRVAREQAVDGGEAARHLVAELAHLGRLAVEDGAVPAPLHDRAVAHHPHLVGAHAQPLDHLLRGELAVDGRHSGDVHSREVVPLADLEGEEAHAQHRVEGELGAQVLVRPRPLAALDLGVEERLQVDHHRMLAGGDQVLVVAVGGGEGVEHREQPAQPLVEPGDLLARPAGLGGGEFHPAVIAAVEHAQGAEAGVVSSFEG